MSRVNPPATGSVVKMTRRERAKATRRRIAEAALARFSGQGYAATTMDAIAGDAGVAVQTVYFTFHTKAELLIAALKIAAVGRVQPKMSSLETGWQRSSTRRMGRVGSH